MQLGASLVLIALGAVLRWAVFVRVRGVDIPIVGDILMIVGAVGFLVSLFMWGGSRRRSDDLL